MKSIYPYLVLLIFGCSFYREIDKPFIEYQEYNCEGYCPVYTVTISDQGLVRYVGKKYDKRLNHYEDFDGKYRISISNLEILKEAIHRDAIFALPDSFNYGIRIFKNDTSIVVINGPSPRLLTINGDSIHKSIFDGGHYAPKQFNDFIDLIHSQLETKKWLID